MMRYAEIPKRERNAITARLQSAIDKYGFDTVRLTANHYFGQIVQQRKVEETIKEKERELERMKKQNRK